MGQADLGELIEKASREYLESMADIRSEADRVRGRGDGEEILKFTVLLNLITSALTIIERYRLPKGQVGGTG